MQQLQFEAAWKKALSAQDRNIIEHIFNETKDHCDSPVVFSPIREAINHKKDLLVTVLVHNFTDYPLTFENTRLVYSNEQEVLAEYEFTLPALLIPPHVSTPWTLIFPTDSYTAASSLWNGNVAIRK